MLTARQAAALEVMRSTGGTGGLKSLVDALSVSKSRASQIVQELERLGYVHRNKPWGRRVILASYDGPVVKPAHRRTPRAAWFQLEAHEREQVGIAALELFAAGDLPAGSRRNRIEDAVRVGAPFLMTGGSDV